MFIPVSSEAARSGAPVGSMCSRCAHGGPLNSNAIYDAFKLAARAAGLPDAATPHTLRHSCASFLHAEGASLKKISVYLGHANTTITNNVYLHLFQSELDDAAATVESLFQTGS